MLLSALRGASKVTAAVTGLLLVYGITCAMEGMTSRIPTAPAHELVITTLYILPWMLLFCSGVEDLGTATRQQWVFWAGVVLGLIFLYYFEHFTTDSTLVKGAMPLIAITAGGIPHVIRRIRFLFTACSLAAGVAGLVALYFVVRVLVSWTTSFATKGIAFLFVAFATTSLATGVLSAVALRRRPA